MVSNDITLSDIKCCQSIVFDLMSLKARVTNIQSPNAMMEKMTPTQARGMAHPMSTCLASHAADGSWDSSNE